MARQAVLRHRAEWPRQKHVGLCIGDGRFIHSASKGVQISTLGTSDPNRRWWYKRWIGVRRIVVTP